MPSFPCPDCGEEFNSKRKREEHVKTRHSGGSGQDSGKNIIQRFKELSTNRKKLAAILFGVLMVGLPLGGGVFYSSLSSSTSSSPDSSGSTGYTNNPPVGYGVQELPQESIPRTTILNSELSKDQQVFLLVNGGTQRTPQGLRPAVLLQYSCTDCRSIVSGLTGLANRFNQGGRWVYVAPYTGMNETIAVSGFQQLDTYESFNQTEIRDSICTKLGDQPLACIEEEFSFSNSTS